MPVTLLLLLSALTGTVAAQSMQPQIDAILKEATRKSAAGATRMEVEAYLKSMLRAAGLDTDANQEADESPTESAAPVTEQGNSVPSWDVYRRADRNVYGATSVNVNSVKNRAATEGSALPQAQQGTYPLDATGEQSGLRPRGYPSRVPNTRDSADAHRGDQDRRNLSVRVAPQTP